MEKPMNRLCDSCLVPLCFLPLSLIIYLFPASDEERVDQFFLKLALLLDHTAFFFFGLQNSGQEEGRSHDVSSGISCGRMDLVFEMPCLGTCHFLSLMCFSCLAARDGCEQ